MVDSVIHLAEQRLEAARKEVSRLENFLATYRDLQSSAGRTQDIVCEKPIRIRVTPGTQPTSVGKMNVTEQAAAQIIRENDNPVPTAEMLSRLLARGVEVGGKNPTSTLSARLSRASSLRFESGKGWTLRSAAPQMKEAADPSHKEGESAASKPTNDAVERGEVEHEVIVS